MLSLRHSNPRIAVVGILLAGLLANPFPSRADDPEPEKPPSSFKIQSGNLSCSTNDGNGTFSVNSWTTGSYTTTSGGSIGGGGSSVRPSLRDFRITKDFDECSAALFNTSVSGRRLATVTLNQYDATNKITLTVVLTDALVSSFELSGSPGAAMPIEAVSFTFGQISITNRANNSKACYNVAQAKTC